MDILARIQQAVAAADSIDDWHDGAFSWKKAFVAAEMSALAYEEVPRFELKKAKRAKVIPCDRYQAHISRWESDGTLPNIRNLSDNLRMEVVTRDRVVVVIVRLRNVIFVSLRGTTLSFADLRADFDARKASYSSGGWSVVKLHRGFLEAVLSCVEEVVDRLLLLNDPSVPIWIAGHSLGGAMSAIMYAHLAPDEFERFFPVRRRRRHHRTEATGAFSFGMPRIGDLRSTSEFPPTFHVFNEFDAIPTLPPTFLGYSDAANERCINAIPAQVPIISKGNCGLRKSRGIATILGLSDHRMEKYAERMRTLGA